MKRPKIYKTKQQKEIDKKLKDAGFTPELLRLAAKAKPMPASGWQMEPPRPKGPDGKPLPYKF